MKTKFIFLILFFACQAMFAQTTTGIAVQGIARDAEKAALADEQMTFVFEIQAAEGGTSYYKESKIITTDPYGVFSHIIGTGSIASGSPDFKLIPYGQTHMKLVITVTYDGNTVEVSNAPFLYTPYAKSADNGVPTGTVVAFLGTQDKLPAGWTICDGRPFSAVSGSENLAALIGGTNLPDLQGMFLRGTGTSPVNMQDGPALRATQTDGFKTHTATVTVNGGGGHSHSMYVDTGGGGSGSVTNMLKGEDLDVQNGVDANFSVNTNSVANHTHGASAQSVDGINETRPVNYGVNYIIKL
jgi:hypothetical protein